MSESTSKLFYLASGIKNVERAQKLIHGLGAEGWTCTYDWTHMWSEENEGSAENKRAISHAEINGVLDCDVFVLFLPGGRGAHVEMGAALASGKPILLLYQREEEYMGDYGYTSVFYYHEDVVPFRYVGPDPQAPAVSLGMEKLLEKTEAAVEAWATGKA